MLKPVSPRVTLTVASKEDPAVDWDRIVREERQAYPQLDSDARAKVHFAARFLKETSEDPSCATSMLPIKDGEQLTKFVIGVVPAEELVRISDDCHVGNVYAFKASTLRWQCFLLGVRDVLNWDGDSDIPRTKRLGGEYVEARWLREQFVMGLRTVAEEIGNMIWSFNLLTETDLKN